MTSASLVMMGLGLFRFGMSTANYQELRRRASYRWAKLDRVGAAPALQYLGPDAEEITLSGTIHPHYSGGLAQVEAMRALAGTGAPLMLVDGLGFVFKLWVITSVNETKTVFLSDGAPLQIDFTVTLQSFVGPSLREAVTNAIGDIEVPASLTDLANSAGVNI